VVTICTTCCNILKLCILPTECIYVFHMVITINSDCNCWVIFQKYAHKRNICKKNIYTFFPTGARAQTQGLTLGFACLNAGLLAGSQSASGSSCDRPTRSRFSVVFLNLRANIEFVPKFHVALLALHAALPMVTSKFRPNVALPILLKFTIAQPSQ
jgi:hypothetical protein